MVVEERRGDEKEVHLKLYCKACSSVSGIGSERGSVLPPLSSDVIKGHTCICMRSMTGLQLNHYR